MAREISGLQNGGIRGQVVADITDKRRRLPGVVVNLSGERLADKRLQAVSDEEGRYNSTGLTGGDYAVPWSCRDLRITNRGPDGDGERG